MSRKLMNLRAKFTMLLLALVWSVSAQTFTITGEVSDENGEPIIGAIVMIQNTNMGTSTDLDGRYTLNNVSMHDVLVFAYVDMQTQEVPVTDERHINVVMKEKKISLYRRIKYFIQNLLERY